jgi:hypothetical protein
MADFTADKKGARYWVATLFIPNNGGSKTVDFGPLPEDPNSPSFIVPMVTISGLNQHAQTYYEDSAAMVYDPVTRTITLTIVNTTPGGGEDGEFEMAVWFPHSSVR